MTDDNAGPHGSRWSRGLTISGIVIAILNMSLAWTMMFSSGPSPPAASLVSAAESVLRSPAASTDRHGNAPARPSARPYSNAGEATASELIDKILRQSQRESEAEDRRTILLLGFCFALISIGFSLFVMGIEGAIGLKGQAGDFGSLVVKTGSPGLFCILLASVLVALSLAYKFNASSPASQPPDRVAILNAETEAKERTLDAETWAKERVIEADSQAKERLLEAEKNAKLEVLNNGKARNEPVMRGKSPRFNENGERIQ